MRGKPITFPPQGWGKTAIKNSLAKGKTRRRRAVEAVKNVLKEPTKTSGRGYYSSKKNRSTRNRYGI